MASLSNILGSFLARFSSFPSSNDVPAFFVLLTSFRASLASFLSFFWCFLSFLSSGVSSDFRFFEGAGISAWIVPPLELGWLGLSSSSASVGPKMGPRKNLEYRPRLAASRLALDIKLSRDVPCSGVVDPESAIFPVTGRRFDKMPVLVRLKFVADDSEESY